MSVKIIAEAGVNHNGSISIARQMIIAAKNAGADYIKFQTFKPESLVSASAPKAEYQIENTKEGGSQLDMLKKLALSFDAFAELREICKQEKIGFISTPFDFESIEFLCTLNMDFWKLPSGEITNLPFLQRIAKTEKPVILSTGMCHMDDVKGAVKLLRDGGTNDITLLHCTSQYPTPFNQVNLRAMDTIARETGLPVGYSDHTKGVEISVAAVAMGAVVIEKHFTLDRNMEGPDHAASLEPLELKAMVSAIRNTEAAFGDGVKKPSPAEVSNMPVVRKSIVAAHPIGVGDVLTVDNLTTKRPGTGISPMHWNEVLGKVATRAYSPDDIIQEDLNI